MECTAGLGVSGDEDAVWVLGHVSTANGAGWLYEPFAAASARLPLELGVSLINAFPGAERIGNKVISPQVCGCVREDSKLLHRPL